MVRMPGNTYRVPRNLSPDRLNAYECQLDASGKPIKGRYVKCGGWYGTFTVERLRDELMPKLAQHAAHGVWSYPFLITYHLLEVQATVHISHSQIDHTGKARGEDIKITPRPPRSAQTWHAVVLSPTEFKLLP